MGVCLADGSAREFVSHPAPSAVPMGPMSCNPWGCSCGARQAEISRAGANSSGDQSSGSREVSGEATVVTFASASWRYSLRK